MSVVLNTLVPDFWARPDIAARAAEMAAADPVEFHQQWATVILEAVLTLLDLAGVEATDAVVAECLLDPKRIARVWDSAKAMGKLTEESAPVPMMDALIALQQTPIDVRETQFAHVVGKLRRAADSAN